MPTEVRDVDGLDNLVAHVLSIARDRSEESFLWFRGVDCANHGLLPKLLREEKALEEVFEREERLLTRFRQRSMAYWPSGYPQNAWEHMFAMQHYGMPTRLLDWTENLFVAAYFAIAGAPEHDHDGSCLPTVWCVDPVEWNRATPVLSEFGNSIQVLTTADDEAEPYEPATSRKRNKSPVAIYGAHNSERIVAQRGTFFVWGNDTKTLEEVATNDFGATLLKFVLRGDRQALQRDMQLVGFGETMVYPELSYLATELSRTEGWRTSS